MKRIKELHLVYAFLLVVSVLGLVVSTDLLRNPISFGAAPGYRRSLTVLVYDLVCVAGILAVLFPVACSRFLGAGLSFPELPRQQASRATRLFGLVVVHGHHPEGSGLPNHEIVVRGRSFCATCYGLLTGAIVSMTIMTAFAVAGRPGWIGTYSSCLLYCVAVATVITGLLCPLLIDVGGKARFILAFVFVVGTSLMLLATELLTENLIADLFVVSLAVFWLLSRISLSHRS